jgi:hypothetical protein
MAEVFTDAGEDFITDLVDGTASAPANYYIAWGTGTTAPAATDTALVTEAAEARVIATESQPSSNVNRFVGTITASGTKTIAEAGLFTASTVGTMLVRGTHTGVPVVSSDQIQYTIEITHTG